MTTGDPTSYAHSMAFLLSQVGARSAQLFAERIAGLGISPRAFAVLSNLGAGEPKTQQQLADALGIHRNNMVALIDGLEAAGWVRRHRGTQDRRTFEVRLTPAGRELVARVNALIPSLDDQLGAALTAEERSTVIAMLGRIARSLGMPPAVHPYVAGRAGGGAQ